MRAFSDMTPRAVFLFALTICLPMPNAEAASLSKVRVVDDDNRGLIAVVEIMASDGKLDYVGTTSSDGLLGLSPAVDCTAPKRLKFHVPAGQYLPDVRDCAAVTNPMREVLTSYSHLASSYSAYQNSIQRNMPGQSALLAADINIRVASLSNTDLQENISAARNSDASAIVPVLQRELDARTSSDPTGQMGSWSGSSFSHAAVVLKVDNASTVAGETVVMTPELRLAIARFQKTNHLPVSKELDYSTLKKMSGSDVGKLVTQ